MGFARFSTTRREHTAVQPLHDQPNGIWVVADVRLDNREELNETLQGRRHPIPSDPELLVLGYRRWGNNLAGHLIGDFAFVLWDERDRTLYAARDPFGVRPLYYHSNARRLVFATEVVQVLALKDFERKIEERAVIDYLSDNYQHDRETFFEHIFRVLPGHYVFCKDRVLRETRYWFPPREELRLGRAADYQAEFRRLFRRSVEDRLETDGRPIIALLSGGLDSPSIVCMADAIYGEGPPTRPPLYTASALFPGLDCDETPFIDAVARKVRFPSERWDGTVREWDDLPSSYIADPSRDQQSAFFAGFARIAARVGARVVLTGDGGDQLLTELGVFRDLAASHQWITLFREAQRLGRHTKGGWLKWVKDGVRNTSPQVLQRAYTSFRARFQAGPNVPPPWIASRLVERWPQATQPPQTLPEDGFHSHTQQYTWGLLAGPYASWSQEWKELWTARRGLRLRFPFFDQRLVHFILSMPFDQRLPGRKWKRFLRKAMEGVLPAELVEREGFTQFRSSAQLQFRNFSPLLRSIICDGPEWLSEPYVDRFEARRLLENLGSEELAASDANKAIRIWDIAMLELWLKDLRRDFAC
jgi:asparagine synthase (glutamine-hydrolysing)